MPGKWKWHVNENPNLVSFRKSSHGRSWASFVPRLNSSSSFFNLRPRKDMLLIKSGKNFSLFGFSFFRSTLFRYSSFLLPAQDVLVETWHLGSENHVPIWILRISYLNYATKAQPHNFRDKSVRMPLLICFPVRKVIRSTFSFCGVAFPFSVRIPGHFQVPSRSQWWTQKTMSSHRKSSIALEIRYCVNTVDSSPKRKLSNFNCSAKSSPVCFFSDVSFFCHCQTDNLHAQRAAAYRTLRNSI